MKVKTKYLRTIMRECCYCGKVAKTIVDECIELDGYNKGYKYKTYTCLRCNPRKRR